MLLNTEPQQLGMGHYWQDLSAGQKFKTFRRTITETDLITFISCTGMLENIFIDPDYPGAIKGRVVPGALPYTLIEGLLLQTSLQGTGLALLEIHKKIENPTFVGDSVFAIVTILSVKPTSKHNRAVVESEVEVFNQDEKRLMVYRVKRLLAGRSN